MPKGGISDRLSGPFRLPEMDPRAMENPISAIFDLSEQVSEKAFYIRKNFWYSLLFVVLWLGVSVAWFMSALTNGRIRLAIFLFLILLSGLFTLRMLYFDYRFFDYFARRYNAIRFVRESASTPHIPAGDSPFDRFLNYLMQNFGAFDRLINEHPESFIYSAALKGRSGGIHQFDAYMGIPEGSPVLKGPHLPRGLRSRGYAFFLRVFGSTPTLADIRALEDAVQDITALTGLPPRVVALTEGDTGELPENVYRHVTEEVRVAKCKKGDFPYTVQVVTGTEGSYDFVPLISSEGLP